MSKKYQNKRITKTDSESAIFGSSLSLLFYYYPTAAAVILPQDHLQMPSTSPGTGQIWILFGVSIFLGFSFIIMMFFS